MYVADVNSVTELNFLLAEAQDRLLDDPDNEQALWDVEDIEDRIDELMFESRYPKLIDLMSRPTPFEESK